MSINSEAITRQNIVRNFLPNDNKIYKITNIILSIKIAAKMKPIVKTFHYAIQSPKITRAIVSISRTAFL